MDKLIAWPGTFYVEKKSPGGTGSETLRVFTLLINDIAWEGSEKMNSNRADLICKIEAVYFDVSGEIFLDRQIHPDII